MPHKLKLLVLLTSFGVCFTTAFSQGVTKNRALAMPESMGASVALAAGAHAVVARLLTLDTALELAHARHPSLVAKRAELGIADGELRQASIYFQSNPEISVRVDRRRVPSSLERESAIGRGVEVFPELGFSAGLDQSLSRTSSQNITEFEIEISQEFEVFGQPRARRRAAEASRDTVLADIAIATWEILANLREEFYRAQIASRRVQLSKEQFVFGNSVLELSKRQLEVGDIAVTEYRQLQIQMSDLKTRLATAQVALSAALNTLRVSTGFGAMDHIELGEALRSSAEMPPTEDVYIAEVLRVNPRLRYSASIIEQREREYLLAKKEGKSNITGTVFFGEEDDNEKILGVGISAPLPLFNRRQGTRAAAKAAIEVARHDAAYVKIAITAQATTALTRLKSTQESALYYDDEILPAIRTNLAQLDNAYRQGEIGMLELRINQRDLMNAQATALEVSGEYYQALAVVEGMIGRTLFDGSQQPQSEFEGNQ